MTGSEVGEPIDVALPVFGAAEELRLCLVSVLRHTDLGRHRLVVLPDGPQDAAVEAVLEELLPSAPRPEELQVEVWPAQRRRGYVANVNRCLEGSTRDVVLLNSDTRVPAGWLEGLARAAVSAPGVASATPFSNNATLCSLPRFLVENHLPTGHDVDSFGRLVREVAECSYPELPTGIGFCLYLRRSALEAVGCFDAAQFGLGYGEEVEWCLRARAAGWRHVLDDATFVYHSGQSSFGTSRDARVRAAHRVMRRLHPDYLPEVADFIRRDPLAPARQRVVARLERPAPRPGLAPRPPERLVHLVHGWPPYALGGTELYARWLVVRQARWRRPSVYARLAHPKRSLGDVVERLDEGVRVRLLVNNFLQRNPLSRNGLEDRSIERDFRRFLKEEEPSLLHVHHLAGHVSSLPAIARDAGCRVVFQLQDWWALCARVNLFHRRGVLCSGPGAARCSACLPLTRAPGSRLWNPLLYRLRWHRMRRALAAADLLVAGSHHVVESHRQWGFLPPGVPVRVVPYGIDREPLEGHDRRHGAPPARPLRVGYVGALLPHKGVDVAVEAFRDLTPEEATLDVWGNPTGDPSYVARLRERAGVNVRLRGTFPESEKGRLLSSLDLLLMPSVGLESFGLVAREAMSVGVPVLVSRRGALVELMEGDVPGEAVEAGNPVAWRQALRRLTADPARLTRWQQRLLPVKGMDEHAEEVEELYREVLEGSHR